MLEITPFWRFLTIVKDKDGLLPRSEYMEFGCRGVHHNVHTQDSKLVPVYQDIVLCGRPVSTERTVDITIKNKCFDRIFVNGSDMIMFVV